MFINKRTTRYFYDFHFYNRQIHWMAVDNGEWCQTNQTLRKQLQCYFHTNKKERLVDDGTLGGLTAARPGPEERSWTRGLLAIVTPFQTVCLLMV